MDKRLGKIERDMVTKDYLDGKLFDLKGDLSQLVRKEDGKPTELVKVLEEKNVVTDEDAKRVLSMEPFPHHQSFHQCTA